MYILNGNITMHSIIKLLIHILTVQIEKYFNMIFIWSDIKIQVCVNLEIILNGYK